MTQRVKQRAQRVEQKAIENYSEFLQSDQETLDYRPILDQNCFLHSISFLLNQNVCNYYLICLSHHVCWECCEQIIFLLIFLVHKWRGSVPQELYL